MKPLLELVDVCKDFETRRRGRVFSKNVVFHAVQDVSFSLHRGQTVGLVGESGSGKSTTARVAAKLLSPTSGKILFDGQDVTELNPGALREFRSRLQFVFQDPYSSLNPRHNVQELVTAPLRYQGRTPPASSMKAYAQELMERVGLNPDHVNRYPHQFSGGQAQRIGIARAIALHPDVVICDEAVSALDVSVQAQVIELLRGLQADFGFSFLFIAHDLAVVRQLAHHVCVMQSGRIVEQGDRDYIFDHPEHEYTVELLSAVPRIPWEVST